MWFNICDWRWEFYLDWAFLWDEVSYCKTDSNFKMFFIFDDFGLKSCSLAVNQGESTLYFLPSKSRTNVILNNASPSPILNDVGVKNWVSLTDGDGIVFDDSLKLRNVEDTFHHQIVNFGRWNTLLEWSCRTCRKSRGYLVIFGIQVIGQFDYHVVWICDRCATNCMSVHKNRPVISNILGCLPKLHRRVIHWGIDCGT